MSLPGFGSTFTLLWQRLVPLVAGLGLVLTSCATYQPPDLPAGQKATIHASQFPYSVNFQKIDGMDIALGSSLRTVTRNSLEVAPGPHTVSILITMRFFEETYDASTNVSFVAEAGKTYVIKTQINSSDHRSLRAWVEESKDMDP